MSAHLKEGHLRERRKMLGVAAKLYCDYLETYLDEVDYYPPCFRKELKELYRFDPPTYGDKTSQARYLDVILESIDILKSHYPEPTWDRTSRWYDFAEANGLDAAERALLLYLLVRSLLLENFEFYHRHEDFLDYLAHFFGVDLPSLYEALGGDSKLHRLGVIFTDLDAGQSSHTHVFLSRTAFRYFFYLTETPFGEVLSPVNEQPYRLDSFLIDSHFLKLILNVLRRGNGKILLEGEPGTGKTELSVSLARELGLSPLILDFGDEELTMADLIFCATGAGFDGKLLVFDEVDSILNTQNAKARYDKGQINLWFDRIHFNSVWIVNDTSNIPSSILRRFDFILPFPTPNAEKRLIFFDAIDTDRVLSDETRRELAQSYSLAPADISQLIRIATEARNTEGLDCDVDTFIKKVAGLRYRRSESPKPRPKASGAPLPPVYDHTLINADHDPDRIVAKIERWKSLPDDQRRGLNILFQGPPGTGKTAFARCLAARCQLPIHVVSSAEILHFLHGRTAMNLRHAFKIARGGILVLDEADSYFFTRDRAQVSWQVQETNAFLQELENHHGICICTTNSLENADPAIFRRFPIKVEFHPLRPQDRFRAARLYFPNVDWDAFAATFASLSDLTLGDFGTAYDQLILEDSPNATTILAALEKAVSSRPRYSTHTAPLGFRITA